MLQIPTIKQQTKNDWEEEKGNMYPVANIVKKKKKNMKLVVLNLDNIIKCIVSIKNVNYYININIFM